MRSDEELSLAEVMGKKLWVSYRLQSLTMPNFIKTANKILQGEHLLLRKQTKQPVVPEWLSAERNSE